MKCRLIAAVGQSWFSAAVVRALLPAVEWALRGDQPVTVDGPGLITGRLGPEPLREGRVIPRDGKLGPCPICLADLPDDHFSRRRRDRPPVACRAGTKTRGVAAGAGVTFLAGKARSYVLRLIARRRGRQRRKPDNQRRAAMARAKPGGMGGKRGAPAKKTAATKTVAKKTAKKR